MCEMCWGSGDNEDINMSKVARVLLLFFLSSTFIARMPSLFILDIFLWMLKRLNVGGFVCFVLVFALLL